MSLLPGAPRFTPPPNSSIPQDYQAGIGRGASGFKVSTRTDFGAQPVRREDPFGPPPPGYIAGVGRGATGFAGGVSRDDSNDASHQAAAGNDDDEDNEENNETTPYDAEDLEADTIYDFVDRKIDERRKKYREDKIRTEIKKLKEEKPSIANRLLKYKRNLLHVSQDEWNELPDSSHSHLKKVKTSTRTYTHTIAPDSLLLSASSHLTTNITTADTPLPSQASTMAGTATPLVSGSSTPLPSVSGFNSSLPRNDLSVAKNNLLSLQLHKASDSISGTTNVDVNGYLTCLSTKINNDLNDVKKMKTLLESLITTDPHNIPAYIALAKLLALGLQKPKKAKEVLVQALQHNPNKEELWLELLALEPDLAVQKSLVSKALSKLPLSINLWILAADYESDKNLKSEILKKALSFVPNSTRLWTSLISLEDPQEAKVLLEKAVACVPKCASFWISLAKLSTPEEAKKVFNRARKLNPTSVDIWLSAARLSERLGEKKVVDLVVERTFQTLVNHSIFLERAEWMDLAKKADKDGYPLTAEALVKNAIWVGVEKGTLKRTCKTEAMEMAQEGRSLVALCVLRIGIEELKKKGVGVRSAWRVKIDLTRRFMTKPEELLEALDGALEDCPEGEEFWFCKTKFLSELGMVQDATSCIYEAMKRNPKSEPIALAVIKQECLVGRFDLARKVVKSIDWATAKISMKHLQFERELIWIALYFARKERGSHPVIISPYGEIAASFNSKSLMGVRNAFYESIELGDESISSRDKMKRLYSFPIKDEGSVDWWSVARQQWKVSVALCEEYMSKHSGNNNICMLLHIIAIQLQFEVPLEEASLAQFDHAKDITQEQYLSTIDFKKVNTLCNSAMKKFPFSPLVFLVTSEVFIHQKDLTKARSLLESCRINFPNDIQTWHCSYYFEKKIAPFYIAQSMRKDEDDDSSFSSSTVGALSGTSASIGIGLTSTTGMSNVILNKALQLFPNNDLLWVWKIEGENVYQQHSMCAEALKKNDTSGLLVLLAAKIFAKDPNKKDKAMKWFERAVELTPWDASIWISYLLFSLQFVSDSHALSLLQRITRQQKFNQGWEWIRFYKLIPVIRLSNIQKIYIYLKSLRGDSLELYPHYSPVIDKVLQSGEVPKVE